MWNEPNKERLAKIPKMFETDNIPLADKLIYLHFHIFNFDWYIAEYDGEDLFWGYYSIIYGETEIAEWGYFEYSHLKKAKARGWLEVNCETERTWRIRKASEVEKIRR